MKAPDKICIRKDDTAPFGFTPHWIYTTKVQEQDTVYIRKDALLEWAENWGKYKLRTDDGFLYAMELLINKLNNF